MIPYELVVAAIGYASVFTWTCNTLNALTVLIHNLQKPGAIAANL